MANSLSSPKVTLSVQANYNDTSSTLTSNVSISDTTATTFTVGTASGNVNKPYTATRTVASGTPDVLDLSVLTDPVNGSVAFLHVDVLKITNTSTVAGQDLTVGGGTAPLFTALPITIGPGGSLVWVNPTDDFAVNASTAHNLQVAAAAGTVTYTITILGRTT